MRLIKSTNFKILLSSNILFKPTCINNNTLRNFSINSNKLKPSSELEVLKFSNLYSSPKLIYESKIKNGSLKIDEFQVKVIKELDQLFYKVLNNNEIKLDKEKVEKEEVKSNSWLSGLKFLLKPKQPNLLKENIAIKVDSKNSMYLFGTVGTGKTMLMDLFYEALPLTLTKRRVHFHAFMIEVHARIHKLKMEDKELEDPISKVADDLAKSAKVLCFDELQVTDIADAMILRRLFDGLFDRNITIITTSNRHPDELYKNGLQRKSFIPCIELIKSQCSIIDLNSGLDYRKFATDSNALYFSPLNELNKVKMNDLFKKFIGEEPAYPEYLNFLGRKLLIPEAANKVARFDFKDLCYQPLNAMDYLEIAKNYHTLFLDNVPKLGDEDRNVGRRFITLIDALYENKNTLIISSTTNLRSLFTSSSESNTLQSPTDRLLMDDLNLTPDLASSSLFTGEEELFAFQRAMSRLIQMQSINWLNLNPKAPNLNRYIDL